MQRWSSQAVSTDSREQTNHSLMSRAAAEIKHERQLCLDLQNHCECLMTQHPHQVFFNKGSRVTVMHWGTMSEKCGVDLFIRLNVIYFIKAMNFVLYLL